MTSWFATLVFFFLATTPPPPPPHAPPVPEWFSHNTQSSHPELSALDSLSSRANKGWGMLSESEGRSLPSRPRCLLTLTLPFSVSHNKGSWRTQHKTWIGHSQSVTDHLRVYYTLLPKRDQKPWALNLFGFVSRSVSSIVKLVFVWRGNTRHEVKGTF